MTPKRYLLEKKNELLSIRDELLIAEKLLRLVGTHRNDLYQFSNNEKDYSVFQMTSKLTSSLQEELFHSCSLLEERAYELEEFIGLLESVLESP